MSFTPKFLNTGNKTYRKPILIPTSWSMIWEIIVMVPTLVVRIQTTTTIRTTLPQSVFQSTKVPAWNVSNAREQMEINYEVRDKREVY